MYSFNVMIFVDDYITLHAADNSLSQRILYGLIRVINQYQFTFGYDCACVKVKECGPVSYVIFADVCIILWRNEATELPWFASVRAEWSKLPQAVTILA